MNPDHPSRIPTHCYPLCHLPHAPQCGSPRRTRHRVRHTRVRITCDMLDCLALQPVAIMCIMLVWFNHKRPSYPEHWYHPHFPVALYLQQCQKGKRPQWDTPAWCRGIAQLTTTHALLNSYPKRSKFVNNVRCPVRGDDQETVKHYVLKCPVSTHERWTSMNRYDSDILPQRKKTWKAREI